MDKQSFCVVFREETLHTITTPPVNTPEEAEVVAEEMLEEGEGIISDSTFEIADVYPAEEEET